MSDISDRNVYILGAGFSAAAGEPLIYDFLDKSRDFLEDRQSALSDYDRETFRRVFEFRRQMARSRERIKLDLDNIEQLFGVAEMSVRLGLIRPETRSDIVHLISRTLSLSLEARKRRTNIAFTQSYETKEQQFQTLNIYQQDSGTSMYRADMYEHFAALISGKLDAAEKQSLQNDTVITFNYDLVLEKALHAVGIFPAYHHTPDAIRKTEKCIDILKLHGSINWAVCPDCRQTLMPINSDQELGADLGRCTRCPSRDYEPLLVPPSWDKNEHREVMRTVWVQAIQELIAARRICIIGYSMPETDSFFKYLITVALAENKHLQKLIVVDRPKSVVLKKYEDILEPVFKDRRFVYFGDGFEQFLANGRAYSELGRGSFVGSLSIY